jgi:hypothetical protein
MLDAGSLSRLESIDPARLHLRLMPGTALLRSPWPIVSIYRAHQLEGVVAEHAFARVRDAIAARRGEDALVVRQGWRAVVFEPTAADARWMQSLLAGDTLAQAIERAGEGFDFTIWLQTAIRNAWVKGAVALDD